METLWVSGINGFTELVVASLSQYGFAALLFLTFIGSLGIPFPVTLVILAAGAFTRQGALDVRLALPACLAGAALADNGEYILGRLAGRWLKLRFSDKPVWRQAQGVIHRQGGWAIVLTRFWLTPLAPAVNLIAGGRYPYGRFLLLDLLGQCLWVLAYGGLGYIFFDRWLQVSQTLGDFTGASVALVFVAIVGALLLRKIRNRRRGSSLERSDG